MSSKEKKNVPALKADHAGISVFDFPDYRQYLQAFFQESKSEKKYFSYRYFARHAGFGSQSYLKMIMDGQRNLKASSIKKIVQALDLSKKEAEYFETLVLYDQAQTSADKDHYLSRLSLLRSKVRVKGLSKDEYDYLVSPYLVIIREMAALSDFKADPEWIHDNLIRNMSVDHVKKSLDVLMRLNLLKKDDDGAIRHSGKTLQTQVDVNSDHVIEFHRQVLSEARFAMTVAPQGEWDVTSVILPMPKDLIPKAIEMMHHCCEQIVQMVNKGTRNFHEVFQINMQLFPVTKTKRDKSKS